MIGRELPVCTQTARAGRVLLSLDKLNVHSDDPFGTH
jgi:simple sugar transport system ATP-binding protein